jgi:hypothetical protein
MWMDCDCNDEMNPKQTLRASERLCRENMHDAHGSIQRIKQQPNDGQIRGSQHPQHGVVVGMSVELMDDGNDDVYNLKPPPPLLPSV